MSCKKVVCVTFLQFCFFLCNGVENRKIIYEHSGGYRGRQNNGIYDGGELARVWPADGPPLLWKAEVGEGYGGVSVVNDMVYIAGGVNAYIYCFTLSGELKRKIPLGSTSWKRFSGVRSTVLIHKNIGIISKPNADLLAFNLDNGDLLWRINIWKDFGTGEGNMGWGYPQTPAVFNNIVIVNPCSRNDKTPPVVGIDFETGKTLWEADVGISNRYSCADCSAAVFIHNGRWISVNPTWRYILCLDPHDGKQLWRIPDPDVNKGSEKTLTPVYNEGYLLFDIADRLVCIKLNEDGSNFTVKWVRPFGGFAHAVILNGRVYVEGSPIDRVWRGELSSILKEDRDKLIKPRMPKGRIFPSFPNCLLCLDIESGKVIDFIRFPYRLGHIVSAGGMICVQDRERSPEGVRSKWVEGVSKLGLNILWLMPVSDGVEITGFFRLPMTLEDARQVKELEYQANVNQVIAAGRLFIRYGPLWVYDLSFRDIPTTLPNIPLSTDNGYWDLILQGFTPDDEDLFVTAMVVSNNVASAVAVCSEWIKAIHIVNFVDVEIKKDTIKGSFMIEFTSDSINRVDSKQIEFSLVRIRVRLRGIYKGGFGKGNVVKGRVSIF